MECPFCNAPYTRKMLDVYNGSCGCDSGCENLTYIVVCESCQKTLYVKGDFGYYDTDEEKESYLDEVEDAEIIEAIQRKIEVW